MTLEQLLGMSAAELKAMSDKELLAFFEPYLKVTRPELAEKPKDYKTGVSSRHTDSPAALSKKQKAVEIARQLGIELDI